MKNVKCSELEQFIEDYFSLGHLLFNSENPTCKKNIAERKINVENFYKDFLDFINTNLEDIQAKEYKNKLELFKNRINTWLSSFREPMLRIALMSSSETLENPKFNKLYSTVEDTNHFFLEELKRLKLNKVKFKNEEHIKIEQKKPLIKKAFIVHGHDNATKERTARYLEKLGFEAVILHEQASGGKTIIEKLEHFTDVGFGIVLYTPDDEGGIKNKKDYKPRARQNVVFEHGLLIGKLGRGRVFPLVTDHSVELPGDIIGMVYLSDNSWELQLAKEIRAIGYEVDMNKVI